MTEEEAIDLGKKEWWRGLTIAERALFQIYEPRLTMPFAVFVEAVEKVVGHPVFTHEFYTHYHEIRHEVLIGSAHYE